MASCGPSCAVPSCASAPVVGFGSSGIGANYGLGLGYGNRGFGYGGLGGGFGGLNYGYGAGGLALGGSTSSAELGTLEGIIPQPINQIPAAEVVLQPPACIVTIPGPILSASCEPVSVGGITPCAAGGSGFGGSGLLGSGLYGGFGYGGLGLGSGLNRFGVLGRKSLLGRRGSVCF